MDIKGRLYLPVSRTECDYKFFIKFHKDRFKRTIATNIITRKLYMYI